MHFTYCPHCGSKLVPRQIGDEGIIPYCDKCSVPLWDMFTTCVIVCVVNEKNEVALLRQNYVSTANYVCVAGIMKLGESAEETVAREVREEIGQDVEHIRYIGSYPYDKKAMLMLGYVATVNKKDFKLSEEVDDVMWVAIEDAPPLLREGGIAYKLVKTVIEEGLSDEKR